MPFSPLDLSQPIPLFPLPNCVLFPGAVQPLHIFEPRYRALMREVLAGPGELGSQHALALALLKPGWEHTYYACPACHDRLCVGRVIAHELLPDGKYNLLLSGVSRARVVSEIKRTGEWGVYRVVRVEALPDQPSSASHESLQRRVLQQLFTRTALKELTVTPALAALFDDPVPIARLIDALAFSLVQDVAIKQRLLEEPHVGTRGEMLLQELVALAGRLAKTPATPGEQQTTWPPQPSVN
jgi:uncharacterized protein